jgi:hypothetical protein
MYILQLVSDELTNTSVVIGCYDSMAKMKIAAQTHKDHNNTLDHHYFYDYKELNTEAKWTNEQEAVWL